MFICVYPQTPHELTASDLLISHERRQNAFIQYFFPDKKMKINISEVCPILMIENNPES